MENEYEIELRIANKEDRKTVIAILADNNYEVGVHKRRKGRSVISFIHARMQEDQPKEGLYQ